MARLTGIAALFLCVAGQTLAQDDAAPASAEDLTLPPVIAEAPGDVRLEPAPEGREEEGIDVTVTGGQNDWRLPDLGTSLREEEEERELDQRMEFVLAPYYDPEKQVEMLEPVPVVDVMRDLGFLRIFEFGFGRRSRQNEPRPDESPPDETPPDETQNEAPQN